MPIVVITGLPASGKTTRAQEILAYFSSKNKKVHLVSENAAVPKALFQKNAYFDDSQKEKIVRINIKSEALRQLNTQDLVIVDAGNYIKGYRYELYCLTKSAQTTNCTVFCCISKEAAWTYNTQRQEADVVKESTESQPQNNSNVPYTREVFEGLCMRYEEPQSNYRWDSPLFVALQNEPLDIESIYKVLYEKTPLPPNHSTQNPPLGATNYLHQLDNIIQAIVKEILGAIKIGAYGQLKIKGCTQTVKVSMSMSALLLNRLRQKFISSKSSLTTPMPLEQAPQLFVQFINVHTSG